MEDEEENNFMWIILSISASLCWAVVNIVDKFILNKWVKNPIIPVMILGIIGFLASGLVYLIRGFAYLSGLNILLALIAGIFYLLMAIFYFKALKIEEVSRIVPLFYFSPLFILLFANLFLNEAFTLLKYLGIFLLVIGAILISFKNVLQLRPSKGFWFMILSTLSISISAVLTKYLLNIVDWWTVFAYIRIGAFIALIPILYLYSSEIIDITKKYGIKVVSLISASESLNLVGVVLLTIATVIGYVSLVSALTSVQAFFVLLISVILGIFNPKILKEEINKSIILQKSIAIILMFTGVVLIT